MDYLNKEISCFRNCFSPDDPKAVRLIDWLTSDKYADQVERIRQTSDKKKRDELKRHLPAITPSGLFTRRDEGSLVYHSGLIQIDIDQQDNQHVPNFDELKEQLTRLSNILYLGRSVSGRGYWGLIPISQPHRHKQHFEALKDDFEALGVVIDPACADVCRLRIYSHDPDGYFNPEAKPYHRLPIPKPHRPINKPKTYASSDDPLLIAERATQKKGYTFTDGQKHLYLFHLACAANALGVPLEELEHYVSTNYPVEIRSNCITGPYRKYRNEFGRWRIGEA